MISILDIILLNTQNHNLDHLIGIIEYFAIVDLIYLIGLIDLIDLIDTTGIMGGVIAHIGIETKCGMIGYGAFHTEVV
jgi:hypothetical protein